MPLGFNNAVRNRKATPMWGAGTLAERPAAGIAGFSWTRTDSPYGIYRDTGLAWVLVASPGGAATPSLQNVTDAGNVTTNNIQANSFIKTGGTSVQFLKADGSIDSNTYLTAAGAVTSITGTANQVIASAATGAVTLSLPQSIAVSSSVTFATETLTTKLNLLGSGEVLFAAASVLTDPTYFTLNPGPGGLGIGVARIGAESTAGGVIFPGSSSYAFVLGTTSGSRIIEVYTSDVKALSISALQVVAFTNPFVLPGTTAQYVRGDGSLATFASGAVTSITGTANQVIASAATGAVTLSLPQSIGTSSNVTFGVITGTSIVKSGGTSSQFLKADGSIDSSTYLTAAGAVTSITGTANQVIASAATGAVTLSLPQSIATSSTVTFGKLIIPADQVDLSIDTGGVMIQSYSLNDCWISNNVYYNSGFKYAQAGTAARIYFVAGGIQFSIAPSGSAGASPSFTVPLTLNPDGTVVSIYTIKGNRFVGNGGTDNTVDTVQSGGGSILGNLFRAEGTSTNTGSVSIDRTATFWKDDNNGSTTYTLGTGSSYFGAVYLFFKAGTGTLTLSGSIVNRVGAVVGSLALTSASGMAGFYYNGTNYYQLF